MSVPRVMLQEKLRRLVEEDLGHGDVTSLNTIPSGILVEAAIIANEQGLAAGIEEARMFLESFGLQAEVLTSDGTEIRQNATLLKVAGDARTLLSIERTLLNLLSRMCGIATATNRLVEKIRHAQHRTRVACTRKTAPGLSYFDKKAVTVGGGDSHRLGLDDMILIKDNHLAVIGGISKALERVRSTVSFSKKVEIEVSEVEEALQAAEAGVDIVMLDNFSPQQAKKTVGLLKKAGLREKVLVEASGGINEQNILDYADAGVDIVSLGEITHSPKTLDISLEITRVKKAL